MKARVKANRLEKADVNYLSLVERGANRSPFKIMKQERAQTMIDLSRMFKSDKPMTKILGYVIQKADNQPKLVAALKSAGAVVDKPVEFEDGTLVFPQIEGFDAKKTEGVVAVKMDNDFVLLAKGFDPYSMTDGTSFGDILKSQGFMPGLSMAMDALATAIRKALVDAEDQKGACADIEDALAEFKDYTAGLANAIPSSAFKALESFRAAKADVGDKKDPLGAGGQSDDAEKAVAEAKKKKDAEAAAAAAVAKTEAEKKLAEETAAKEKVAKEEAAAKAKKEEDERAAAAAKAGVPDLSKVITESIAAAMKPLSEQVGAVSKSVTEMGAKVDEAVKTAKEAKETAGKVVLGAAQDDDEVVVVNKKEGGMGCIDTAFNKGIRKADRERNARRAM